MGVRSHGIGSLEGGAALRKRSMVQKVQLSRMLDERKTPIDVDYSDEHMSFKNLVQPSSFHVRTATQ